MPLDERRERHAALLPRYHRNDVNKWQKDFLDALRNEHLRPRRPCRNRGIFLRAWNHFVSETSEVLVGKGFSVAIR